MSNAISNLELATNYAKQRIEFLENRERNLETALNESKLLLKEFEGGIVPVKFEELEKGDSIAWIGPRTGTWWSGVYEGHGIAQSDGVMSYGMVDSSLIFRLPDPSPDDTEAEASDKSERHPWKLEKAGQIIRVTKFETDYEDLPCSLYAMFDYDSEEWRALNESEFPDGTSHAASDEIIEWEAVN